MTPLADRPRRSRPRDVWRGLTRDQFVAEVVFERPLIVVGRGGDSNMIKALKGIEPFDGSEFRRMPAGPATGSCRSVRFY
jgi:hypothetical protein